MKIKVHPLLGLLFILVAIAAFITIPVVAFYVLPKSLVWSVNWLLALVFDTKREIPFNFFTWAIAVYLFWITGVARVVSKELKTVMGNLKLEATPQKDNKV